MEAILYQIRCFFTHCIILEAFWQHKIDFWRVELSQNEGKIVTIVVKGCFHNV